MAGSQFLTFQINADRYALPLSVVDRVIQAVELRELPNMPGFLHGIINFHDTIIPVINAHYLFYRGSKSVELSDHFIITSHGSYRFAILVDTVLEVIEQEASHIDSSQQVMDGKDLVKGIIKLENDLVLISDIEKFLNAEELKKLDASMKQVTPETKSS